MKLIDWSALDKFSENTCTCRCGAIFRSHSKCAAVDGERLELVSRIPCPACGSHQLVKASSDCETQTANTTLAAGVAYPVRYVESDVVFSDNTFGMGGPPERRK